MKSQKMIKQKKSGFESKMQRTVVVKNGWAKASLTVILFSGSTTRHFLMRSFGSSAKWMRKN